MFSTGTSFFSETISISSEMGSLTMTGSSIGSFMDSFIASGESIGSIGLIMETSVWG